MKLSLVVGATGLMLVFGCSSGKSTGGGTGGVPSGGGVIGTGGTVSTGGLVGTGGSTNSPGGGPGSGGIGTGGIRGTGGIVGTGGSTNSPGGGPGGGGIGTGGIVGTGGIRGTGGIVGTGGIGGTAGIRGTGGNVTGGVRGTGGVPAGTGGVSAAGGSTTTQVPGATLFPASAPWYQDVTGATLDAQSAAVIAGLSAKGGWGAGSFRIDFSIEVLKADASVTPRAFTKSGDFYDPDCDFVPMPVPPTGRLEGETNYACASDGDCHLLVIQGTKLFEMWRANITGGTATGTPFDGGCLAVWDLTRDYWKPATPPAPFARGDQCTSADAAGYPISALLFSADEVASGSLNHAIRFILPNDRITKGAYVHPATHSGAGKGTPSNDTVPYGARLRLKSTFNLAGLPNEGARTVAKALQRYGMFLADGGNIALTAQADTYTTAKWSGLLGSSDLSTVKVTDFEMIDGGTRIPLTLDCVRTPL